MTQTVTVNLKHLAELMDSDYLAELDREGVDLAVADADQLADIIEGQVEARWERATDLAAEIVSAAVDRLRAGGHDVQYVRGDGEHWRVYRLDADVYIAVGADGTREGDPLPAASWAGYEWDGDRVIHDGNADGTLLTGADPIGDLVAELRRALGSA